MECIKIFKGTDKKLAMRYLSSGIASIVLLIIAVYGLMKIPYGYGYNNYMDRKITIYMILAFVALCLSAIEIGFWITAKKNEVCVYAERIHVKASEFKWMFPYKNLEYDILFSDVQRVSVMMIEGYKFIVINADKEYKICLEEAEKCMELLKRMKNRYDVDY